MTQKRLKEINLSESKIENISFKIIIKVYTSRSFSAGIIRNCFVYLFAITRKYK